jgi:hypothetical protein
MQLAPLPARSGDLLITLTQWVLFGPNAPPHWVKRGY